MNKASTITHRVNVLMLCVKICFAFISRFYFQIQRMEE
uniref:Uncharacterized protein n=1 Tax=Anguilla anguilla TaxID=7936 RepID=A0A0E9QRM7_ANGAN